MGDPAAAAKAWPRWPSWTGRFDKPGRTPSWRRRLTFTRLGRWYCGLTIGIGMAAINTGNNLLFLVLGLLLGSIVVSGVLSENAVARVSLERRLPRSATAGQAVLVGLCARRSGKLPGFSLELREAGGDVAGSAWLLVLPPGEEQEAAYSFTPKRRGRHRFERLEVATRSPFGLFEKSRPVDAPGELVVFPRAVPPPEVEVIAPGREGERPQQRVGHGQEVHGLRDHRPGEDVRSIHWKSTARAGKLIAVEREQERRARVCVVLDQRGLAGEPLERAIEQAAALFLHAADEGAEAGLAIAGALLPCGSGQTHLAAGLTLLALLEAPAGPLPEPQPPPGTTVITARARRAA